MQIGNLTIFDVFHKCDNIYFIIAYSKLDKNDLILYINDKKLMLNEEMINKDGDLPIIIFHYKYSKQENEILNSIIKYKNEKYNFVMESIKPNNYTLTYTTLFKYDYKVFETTYNYYIKQGVEHFYLYYNGIIDDEIQNHFEGYNNITLIEWNYPYRMGMSHYAQSGQINSALYKYGKNNSKYMIFCDFDEYLYIDDNTNIKQYLMNTNLDLIGFRNRWSLTENNIIPKHLESFNVCKRLIPYKERSKNIYKTSEFKFLGVHSPAFPLYENVISKNVDMEMFHFYFWSGSRKKFHKEEEHWTFIKRIINI